MERIIEARLEFFNEGEKYGEHVVLLRTDLDDEELMQRRHDIAALCHLDDDRLPDRHATLALEELEEAPDDAILHDLRGGRPTP